MNPKIVRFGLNGGALVMFALETSDAGATWSKISSAYAVQIIRADSNGKVFFTEGNTKPLYVSNNQGGSFSLINSLSLPNSGVSYPEDIAFTKNIMFDFT